MRAAVLCLSVLVSLGLPSVGRTAEPLTGIYALPDGKPKVTATMVATGSGAKQVLDIAMTPIGAATPATAYETELSKQLHVIAVSQDLRSFVHEHGEAPGKNGHFRIPINLSANRVWHVYADGIPKGLGQQVMRFDLKVGTGVSTAVADVPKPTGTKGADGRYGVRFDGMELKAGQEAQLGLHLLRDGDAAPDISPFLGVAAHAVFIDATDLTYVHAHAAPTEAPAAGGTATPMQHDMTGMAGMKDMPGMADMPGMEGMGPPVPPGSHVPPDLTLHITAPKAGTYMLWIQFDGGGQVRTVPFVVAVT